MISTSSTQLQFVSNHLPNGLSSSHNSVAPPENESTIEATTIENGINGEDHHEAEAEGLINKYEVMESICDTLYQSFTSGLFSDLVLHVSFPPVLPSSHSSRSSLPSPSQFPLQPSRKSYRCHRLLLSRSPVIAELLREQEERERRTGWNGNRLVEVEIKIDDKNIDEESFLFSLSHLYSPTCLPLVSPSNARPILASSTFLRLPDLSSHCAQICKQSISSLEDPKEIRDWIDFLETRVGGSGAVDSDEISTPYTNGSGSQTPSLGRETPQRVPSPAFSISTSVGPSAPLAPYLYSPYSQPLLSSLISHIVRVLPSRFSSFGSNRLPAGTSRLISIYSTLPFETFKSCVESPELGVGVLNDRERFEFAKKCVVERKRKGMWGAGGDTEESVVLAFGVGSGSVSVIRKRKRGRVLWKVKDGEM